MYLRDDEQAIAEVAGVWEDLTRDAALPDPELIEQHGPLGVPLEVPHAL
jgi:hypothetical protein